MLIKDGFILLWLGLVMGSFANVCIYRWPRNLSIFFPIRSECPWCHHQIRWFDNLPLLSYFLLGRRCRDCRSPIHYRYPLVEAALPLLWMAGLYLAYHRFGPMSLFFHITLFLFFFVIVVTTATDLEWQIIPDAASLPLMGIGLLFSYWNPILGSHQTLFRFVASLLGFAVGGGTLLIIAFVGNLFFKKDVMGGGDIKLLAAFGAFLGWEGALVSLFAGSLIGGFFAIIGLLTRRLKRHQTIPFGPLLNLGGLIAFYLKITYPSIIGLVQ